MVLKQLPVYRWMENAVCCSRYPKKLLLCQARHRDCRDIAIFLASIDNLNLFSDRRIKSEFLVEIQSGLAQDKASNSEWT